MTAYSTSHLHPTATPATAPNAPRAFTITELLVVIALIVLLVTILLTALSVVQTKARATRTTATLESFANACEAFQQEHGFYPGVVPEDILISDTAAAGGVAKMSSTESALLHLMGGYVREADVGQPAFTADYPPQDGWKIVTFTKPNGDPYRVKVNLGRLGEGPVINGKPFAPYYTPNDTELRVVTGQVGDTAELGLPDLVDAWGQPIIFVRRERTVGPLNVNGAGTPAQFHVAGMTPYTRSTDLGKLREDQFAMSIFSAGGPSLIEEGTLLAWMIAHPALSEVDSQDRVIGEPRGSYMLLSAGADGVFFSTQDGAGSPGTPITTAELLNGGALAAAYTPKIFGEYDDVVVFGGS